MECHGYYQAEHKSGSPAHAAFAIRRLLSFARSSRRWPCCSPASNIRNPIRVSQVSRYSAPGPDVDVTAHYTLRQTLLLCQCTRAFTSVRSN